MRHEKKRGCSPLLIILALLVWGVMNGTIPKAMGRWLLVSMPLEKADVLYVYSGGSNERPAYTAELYRKGYAQRVIVSGILMDSNLEALGLYFNDGTINRRILIKHGVPGPRIVQMWYGTSTYDETQALRHYLVEHKLKSAIVVSSPFHTRRIRMTVRRVFKNDDIKIIIAPVKDTLIPLDAWWKTENDFMTVLVEYIKIVYYICRYR